MKIAAPAEMECNGGRQISLVSLPWLCALLMCKGIWGLFGGIARSKKLVKWIVEEMVCLCHAPR